jgi:hypothetical protein
LRAVRKKKKAPAENRSARLGSPLGAILYVILPP